MTQEIAIHTEETAALATGSAFSSEGAFIAAQRMAKALVNSTMVPKHYQGNDNIGNAIIALEMAQRIDASPLMVMQNLYMVHGQPGWASKFLIATFNQSGRFSAIRYEWKGEPGKKDRACRAYAIEKTTGDQVDGPWIDWPLIDAEGWDKKPGSKWKTMPEKMFMYRAAAWMIDTVAPEIGMGIPPADQLDDMNVIDVTPVTEKVVQLNEVIKAASDDRKETVNQETGEIKSEAPDKTIVPYDELKTVIEHSTDLEELNACKAEVFKMDARTKEYKELSGLIDIRRGEMENNG